MSAVTQSPAPEDPKPKQQQRNYAITCAGIVVVLQTLVPGSLFILSAGRERKCVEIRIDPANVGKGLQSMDVKATIRTMAVDGLPERQEEAAVTVEELEDSEFEASQTQDGLASDSLDADGIQGAAVDATNEANSDDALVAPGDEAAVVQYYKPLTLARSPAFRLSASADGGPVINLVTGEPWVVPRPAPVNNTAPVNDTPQSMLPSAPLMPPSASSSSHRTRDPRRSAPRSKPVGSTKNNRPPQSEVQGGADPVAGPSRNTTAGSSMLPPPVVPKSSRKKRGAAEMAEEDESGPSEGSPPKRAKAVPALSTRKTRSAKN
ncbi:hypothetical protein B0H17DRAFT_1210214 [Mycena rosella]|uniref:Uncharacterized protein n=1 Tax=Mycena rosella TaxID=1033263 RepID=A0AAD7G599_MYCRO|nr:hypothetical protein B0H17DRAFT_1210214 [Mycena rosella]